MEKKCNFNCYFKIHYFMYVGTYFFSFLILNHNKIPRKLIDVKIIRSYTANCNYIKKFTTTVQFNCPFKINCPMTHVLLLVIMILFHETVIKYSDAI